MSVESTNRKGTVDWPTTIAIAAIGVSLSVGIHEGVHALTCFFGGDVIELAALHVDCNYASTAHAKVTAGSAAIVDIILGTIMLMVLRRSRLPSTELTFFVWLFMVMNWLGGAGYFMFSGIANVGDWAAVIEGWEPAGLWRGVMAIFGTGLYTFFVWLSLKELGKIIGGSGDEQIGRAVKLGLIAYFTSIIVIFLAGMMNSQGMKSLTVFAGLLAIVGGLSPLLWMMQWFRAKSFVKLSGPQLEIKRQIPWMVTAVIVVAINVFILGPSIFF